MKRLIARAHKLAVAFAGLAAAYCGPVDWTDIAIRAAKTFVQTFIAAITATHAGLHLATVWAAAVSAGAATVALVWNTIKALRAQHVALAVARHPSAGPVDPPAVVAPVDTPVTAP